MQPTAYKVRTFIRKLQAAKLHRCSKGFQLLESEIKEGKFNAVVTCKK
jgi:hypothetical protein